MTGSPSQSNDGTALSGDQYARRNSPQLTEDGTPRGRWVAMDESGWDGDQLHGGDRSRYLIVGSVAISDTDAQEIVETVRNKARIQAPELKFSTSFSSRRQSGRRQILKEILSSGGPLEGRTSIYVLDKHYFITAKIVDLFVEERAHARGEDIRNTGQARNLARDLFIEGPRALGADGFDRLIAKTVAFASKKNSDGLAVTIDEFFESVEVAWTHSRRRKVSDVLELLRDARDEASEYAEKLQDGSHSDGLEPLIPSVQGVTREWAGKIGRINILTDDQVVLTDKWLDRIHKDLSGLGYPEFRHLSQGRFRMPLRIGELVRGQSKSHPSLELADLVSGAGFAVAKYLDGKESPAGEELYSTVLPLLSPSGFLPYDEISDWLDATASKRVGRPR